MIKEILDCLKEDFPHNSKYIAIAKGMDKIPETMKELKYQIKNRKNGTRSRG